MTDTRIKWVKATANINYYDNFYCSNILFLAIYHNIKFFMVIKIQLKFNCVYYSVRQYLSKSLMPLVYIIHFLQTMC